LVWACLAAAGSGFVVGLRFRVVMLLPLALALIATTLALAVYAGWNVSQGLGVTVLLLVIQQAAYLLGLFVSARQ
jgi:multidrug efflux pump subunit AcrB